MLKVLFLINNLSSGGAERVLVNLVNQLDCSRFDITVRTLTNVGDNRHRLSTHIKYEYVYKKGFKGTNYLHLLPKKYIYNKVTHGNFDIIVVYLHGVLTKIVSYAPSHQKTVAYLHANMEQSPFMQQIVRSKNVDRYFLPYNKIVAVSEDVKQSFLNVTGYTNDRVDVIYNTFAVDEICQLADESQCVPVKQEDEFRICCTGKLDSGKGVMRLLKIVRQLIREGHSNLTVYFIGDGSERADMERYIQDNGLYKHIHLVGYCKNPYAYMKSANLYVCPSYSEGFSSVVCESLILHVPVLTTDCAGMKEILDDNEYGMIVSNTDEALYSGIKELIDNKELLNFYQEKTYERATFFSPQNTVKQVETLLTSI